jgi:poly-gamma-glutamate synthesis protein (capsule biosynthesis protein)
LKKLLIPGLVIVASIVAAFSLNAVQGAIVPAYGGATAPRSADAQPLGVSKKGIHTATILAFGDLMLDRSVRVAIEANGPEYPFAPLKDFLTGYDIVVANAEGAFTSSSSVSVDNHALLQFTFDPSELPTLKKLGFTLFSQANNHALNFGMSGLRQSQSLIRASGMETFGDPLNDNPGPYYQTVRGIKIAFVGYHQFSGTDTNVIAAIRQSHAAGAFTIVYPHWGEEYLSTSTPFQQTKAHAFIDAGADLILGAHPHVIEPIEIYKGKAIFYSLGNFIFDQSNTGPTSEGLSVGISLEPGTVSYTLFPLKITRAQASVMGPPDQQRIFMTMAENAMLSGDEASLRNSIAGGYFSLVR